MNYGNYSVHPPAGWKNEQFGNWSHSPLKYRSRRRPRRRSSHKPPLGTAARAEGSDQLRNSYLKI